MIASDVVIVQTSLYARVLATLTRSMSFQGMSELSPIGLRGEQM